MHITDQLCSLFLLSNDKFNIILHTDLIRLSIDLWPTISLALTVSRNTWKRLDHGYSNDRDNNISLKTTKQGTKKKGFCLNKLEENVQCLRTSRDSMDIRQFRAYGWAFSWLPHGFLGAFPWLPLARGMWIGGPCLFSIIFLFISLTLILSAAWLLFH